MLNMSYLFTDSYDFSVVCCDLKDHTDILVDNTNAKYTVKPQNQNILRSENFKITFGGVFSCGGGGGWGGGGPKATH
jgi:hypothetical protein